MKKLIIGIFLILTAMSQLHRLDPINIYNAPTPKGFQAGVLYPFVLFKDSEEYTMTKNYHTYHHEYVHVAQIKQHGFIGFYIKYTIESWQKGYHNISFEIEAYKSERGKPHHNKLYKHK